MGDDTKTTSLAVDAELAAALAKAAAEHGTTREEIVDHVLREYVRFERLSALRAQREGVHPGGFTTWREQLTFAATLAVDAPKKAALGATHNPGDE